MFEVALRGSAPSKLVNACKLTKGKCESGTGYTLGLGVMNLFFNCLLSDIGDLEPTRRRNTIDDKHFKIRL